MKGTYKNIWKETLWHIAMIILIVIAAFITLQNTFMNILLTIMCLTVVVMGIIFYEDITGNKRNIK